MKKFFKVLGIVILCALGVCFLIYTIRNYFILMDLKNKISVLLNNDNLHIRIISNLESDNPFEIDYFRKDEKVLKIQEEQIDDKIKTITEFNDGNITRIYVDNGENKVFYIDNNKINLTNEIFNEIKIDNFFQNVIYSFIYRIFEMEIDGEQFYVIKTPKSELYLEKNTGLLVKSIMDGKSIMIEYEFNVVEDSFFVEPDISEYQVQNSN